MLSDTGVSVPPTVIAAATSSFDPWDMPYFGAATYFSYQATLWHAESPGRDQALLDHPVAPAPALLSASAVVSMSSNLQLKLAPGGDVIDNRAGEQMPTTSGPASRRKRPWWTRLFGQS